MASRVDNLCNFYRGTSNNTNLISIVKNPCQISQIQYQISPLQNLLDRRKICIIMAKPMLTAPLKYNSIFIIVSRLDNNVEKIKRVELNKRAGWKKVHK